MKKLFAFGCSNTYGQGLSDCFREYNFAGATPSKYAWPAILAKKLGYQCENRAHPGSSNKEIWNTILNTEISPLDIVVVAWTYPTRWCVINDDNDAERQILINMNDKPSKLFFKHFYTSTDMNLDVNLRMHHVHALLQANRVKNFHSVNNHGEFTKASWNPVDVLDTTMSAAMKDKPFALDNAHPGVEAQENFANLLHNEIKGKL